LLGRAGVVVPAADDQLPVQRQLAKLGMRPHRAVRQVSYAAHD
jgi:hypothetical protein